MPRKKTQGVRVKITKDRIMFLVATLLFAVFVYYIIANFYKPPLYKINFYGNEVGFRADVREAWKVPTYPSEDVVFRELMNPFVDNVTIVFKPSSESENAYYVVEILEIVAKMRLAYAHAIDEVPTFNEPVPVESYDNLGGKIQDPMIVLFAPSYSNETSIRSDGHVVYVRGKTFHDFDLAVAKLIMIALGVEGVR